MFSVLHKIGQNMYFSVKVQIFLIHNLSEHPVKHLKLGVQLIIVLIPFNIVITKVLTLLNLNYLQSCVTGIS